MINVLIITYYWPPAGGPAVQRILNFCKYLPKFGWNPIVLTVKNGEYYYIDKNLMNKIPHETKVFQFSSWEPYTIYKKITNQNTIPVFELNKQYEKSFLKKFSAFIRMNVFIPDPKIFMIPKAVYMGNKIIKNNNIKHVITSSPPHSIQIIGYILSKIIKIKWITDFRDPWTKAFWFQNVRMNYLSIYLNKLLEKIILKNSDHITSVSKSFLNDFTPHYQRKKFVLQNGYEPTDFKYNKISNNTFTITYAGSLSLSQTDNNFLHSLTKLPANVLNNLYIEFTGDIHPTFIDNISKNNLTEKIIINSNLSHSAYIKKISCADILLLFIPNTINNNGIVTGKLYEYLATKNYILGIGPVTGDAAKIINYTRSGIMLEYDTDFSKIIIDLYNKWYAKQRLSQPVHLDEFTRERQANDLANLLDSV